MAYDGIEVFMMCIGNADCFLAKRYHSTGAEETVLIDGGSKSNAEDIAALQSKLALLKDQKRFLLNNLVTGAMRLPEFAGPGGK